MHKHGQTLISAYAGDQHVIRQVGEVIHRGQIVAYVRNMPKPRVHFEIRAFGKAVNPMHYLQLVKPSPSKHKQHHAS